MLMLPLWKCLFNSVCCAIFFAIIEIIPLDRRRIYFEARWCCKLVKMLGSCLAYSEQPSKVERTTSDREGREHFYRYGRVWCTCKRVDLQVDCTDELKFISKVVSIVSSTTLFLGTSWGFIIRLYLDRNKIYRILLTFLLKSLQGNCIFCSSWPISSVCLQ